MIVDHFYFGMIKADEKYVQGLMFHIFLDNNWSYKLVRIGWFKVCLVMQTRLWISEEEKLVRTFFAWYQKVTDAGHFL